MITRTENSLPEGYYFMPEQENNGIVMGKIELPNGIWELCMLDKQSENNAYYVWEE